MFAVAETRRRATLRNPIKSAIIASGIVHFGFARMFQTLNDNPQIVVAIFGDDESALQWLRLAGVRPPDVAWHPSRSCHCTVNATLSSRTAPPNSTTRLLKT